MKGKTFGELKVLELNEECPTKDYSLWWCLCGCGRRFVAISTELESGDRETCYQCSNTRW